MGEMRVLGEEVVRGVYCPIFSISFRSFLLQRFCGFFCLRSPSSNLYSAPSRGGWYTRSFRWKADRMPPPWQLHSRIIKEMMIESALRIKQVLGGGYGYFAFDVTPDKGWVLPAGPKRIAPYMLILRYFRNLSCIKVWT